LTHNFSFGIFNPPKSDFLSIEIVMLDGFVLGKGTKIITTNNGAKKIKQRGLEAKIGNIQEGWFYKGRPPKK